MSQDLLKVIIEAAEKSGRSVEVLGYSDKEYGWQASKGVFTVIEAESFIDELKKHLSE